MQNNEHKTLQIFKNELFEVGAKIESETILFDAEQVAKCLGITDTKNGTEYVRWNRVNSYLPPNSPQVAKGSLIPEPLVYKLAFKASNEVAEQFQDWLAIDVIPAIRKTGSYIQPVNNLELALQAALQHEQDIKNLKSDIGELKETMRIDSDQEYTIRKSGQAKALEAMGGIESSAYRRIGRKVFQAFWRDFKKYFKIARYTGLPRLKFAEALRFIETWRPETALQMEIDDCNKYKQLELVEGGVMEVANPTI
ncbi:ORF6C domain-containing protein [Rummeliibacillus sp. TYF-LIM-RU47]|uniref:ORF6C domain-containing protein n=1 Tax=Rummeliibacillus sp. TYF-LIM-RU47 TaxID=2608406 RepID=UPI00123A9968|nr:ORF6C domain-containing protein [Rummeliibacillus sp. TYF-LIM-RU47]